MGDLIRGHNWAATPVGPITGWPQSLRVAVRLLLTSRHPMFIWWGPELIQFYNDAYAASLGPEKHPAALGARARDTWPEIWDVIGPQIAQVMAGGEATWHEDQLVPIIRRGGRQDVWWTYSYSPIDDEHAPNGVGGVLVICDETTAEVTSREKADARYRALFETIDAGFCVIEMLFDADGRANDYRFVEANAAFEQQSGLINPVGRRARELVPDLEQHWYDLYGAVATTGRPARFENGSDAMGRWFDVHALRVGDPSQHRVAVLFNDISARRAAEIALRASEDRLSAIFAEATVGLSEVSLDGRFLRVNDELCRLLGRDRNALLTASVFDVTLPEDIGPSLAAIDATVRTREPRALDKRYLRPDGTIVWANSRLARLHDPDGGSGNLLVVTVDLTERRAAEQRLRESEASFRLMADAVPQIVWIIDAEGRAEFYNKQWADYTGIPHDASTATLAAADYVHPDDGPATVAAFDVARRTGRTFTVEHRIRSAAGEYRWFLVRGEPHRDVDGEIVRWFGASIDIHDRKLAEARLSELNETLEQRVAAALAERKVFSDVIENSTAAVTVIDLDHHILAINRTSQDVFERLYGTRPHVGDGLLDLLDGMPAHREQMRANWARALAGKEFVLVQEFGDAGLDRRHYEVRLAPIHDSDGNRIGAASTAYDVTDRIRAEQQLETTQEQLRQAQKMEAMGQLTGGVAHDFNNLLTPIVGSLDLLQRRRLGGEREQRMIAGAMQSADRAKTLVQRLLAFARRQPLQPVAVDVAELITGMADLVASTTGPQIKVVAESAAGLPHAKADPNQLEMALLNLAVNARDAMPDGGTLRITASADEVEGEHRAGLEPGRYIRLSVADTGVGMDEATMVRAVEPFFSTKGIGKGTGLGLSMVHGLASQLGGALTIRSRPGLGTNVELWLPQSCDAPDPSDSAREVRGTGSFRGMALLVDDEDVVRMSTADMLSDLGYSVIEACSAEEALQMVEQGERFDLLVTDHLMPGMNGTDLARKVRARRPGVPALIVSGYAEEEGIDPDLPRLAKPFRKDELGASLLRIVKG
ncbi:Blue-light-activated protein [Sphingomonas jeddahensis]|uniref:histidine kinase n=2 Tax=Sphingomonas jeddahensis TaxID=1915074 RepID=A0A1V2ER67_9SPHN|nr:Blue-light-activated protein [Sphingomonas jeddahensis]